MSAAPRPGRDHVVLLIERNRALTEVTTVYAVENAGRLNGRRDRLSTFQVINRVLIQVVVQTVLPVKVK